jgi:hypothetical protein
MYHEVDQQAEHNPSVVVFAQFKLIGGGVGGLGTHNPVSRSTIEY